MNNMESQLNRIKSLLGKQGIVNKMLFKKIGGNLLQYPCSVKPHSVSFRHICGYRSMSWSEDGRFN